MKALAVLAAFGGIACGTFGQTAAPNNDGGLSSWSGAEFVQRGDVSTIVLTELKAYAPFKFARSVTLGFDVFAGYSTTSGNGVAGFGAVLRSKVWGNLSGVVGVGQIADLSKQFQLNQLTIQKAGLILGASYSF